VIAASGAELVAHTDAMDSIPGVDRGLIAGDDLQCGEFALKVMDTPGHTMSHICLYFLGNVDEQPALFCGDTLFNAGVGRCDFGGEPKILHKTFEEQIFPLADNVRIFPGHNYIENNLEFTLDREPDNKSAISLREKFKNGLDAESFVSDIGLEREINVFFRADQREVREGIASSLNINLSSLDNQQTFIGLRKLRDSW
jgi:hydroxyacylglutathione hydrolase